MRPRTARKIRQAEHLPAEFVTEILPDGSRHIILNPELNLNEENGDVDNSEPS